VMGVSGGFAMSLSGGERRRDLRELDSTCAGGVSVEVGVATSDSFARGTFLLFAGTSSGADKAARTCARGAVGARDVNGVGNLGIKAIFDEKKDRRFLAPMAGASGLEDAMIDPGWEWDHPGGEARFICTYYKRR